MNVDDAWGEKMSGGGVCGEGGAVLRADGIGNEIGIGDGRGSGRRAVASGLITHMGGEGMSINLASPEAARDVWQPMLYKMATPLVGRHNSLQSHVCCGGCSFIGYAGR